jgi:hypothetical protein
LVQRPDEFLKKQLSNMIDVSKLKDLSKVDIAVGGDHGGGKLWMTLKGERPVTR